MSEIRLDLSNHPSLATAYEYSNRLLARLGASLERHAGGLSAITTVALGGSLGRLEAHRHSDFDCLIFAADDAPPETIETETMTVMRLLGESGLKAPKVSGIYGQAIQPQSLLDPAALGSLSESPQLFGHRMQLLLDAQPVFRPGQLRELQRAVLAWYGSGFHQRDPAEGWAYLINDLGRYRHAYSAWQRYKLSRSNDDSWQLRQAKLRSSRTITFASFNFVLGITNHSPNKHAEALDYLRHTPLQRLALIMRRYDNDAFGELLNHYEALHRNLSDYRVRSLLVNGGPETVAGLAGDFSPVHTDLQQHANALAAVLSDFFLQRRNDWDPRFFTDSLL